jgi:hypothetical protein
MPNGTQRRHPGTVLAASLLAALMATIGPSASPVRAAEYELETVATYAVDPAARRIEVAVDLEFTNTTPDPDGQFSVFEEVRLAIHDAAEDVTASDGDGDLSVDVAVEEDVTVATIELRDGLRYEESVDLELGYVLPDTDDPQLRVRSSIVVFPAWGFGTRSRVSVTMPDSYEVRVDGDPLRQEGGAYVSGVIADPSAWLALVTGLRPLEHTSITGTVPLEGGTADISVRALVDDEAWGQRILDLVVEALPRLEAEFGLPYPLVGQLVVTEAVPADASGFGESGTSGTEVLIAYDQPDFTAIHQLAHVWLSGTFADARWIREGLASLAAARVAESMDIELPYDPVAETETRAEAAFPLDEWPADARPGDEAYGYAASWAFAMQIEEEAGADALRTVLRRVAASVGPFEAVEIEPQPPAEDVHAPAAPLTTRAFLDHLETVTDADLAPLFAERVLSTEDAALLDERAAARTAFDALAVTADSWGTPDPVRAAMTDWDFETAQRQIDEARSWLEGRDRLLGEMAAVGLSPSERLEQAYRAYGGGPEAVNQLEAHDAVVAAYAEAAEEVNAERSLVERIGLIGGDSPTRVLAEAHGHVATGELREAAESVTEARRLLAAAETSGIVRLVSAIIIVVLLLAVAVALFRRRASYTSAP